MDLLNGIFKRRFRGGTRPPLDFFVQCYMKTMNHFVDQISVHGKSLSDTIKETSSWIHVWNSWDPPAVADTKQSTKDHNSLTPEMKSQMNRMNQMAINMTKQASKNSYAGNKGGKNGGGKNRWNPYPQAPEFPPINPNANFKGNKGNKGNKGKGKGKGKGGKW